MLAEGRLARLHLFMSGRESMSADELRELWERRYGSHKPRERMYEGMHGDDDSWILDIQFLERLGTLVDHIGNRVTDAAIAVIKADETFVFKLFIAISIAILIWVGHSIIWEVQALFIWLLGANYIYIIALVIGASISVVCLGELAFWLCRCRPYLYGILRTLIGWAFGSYFAFVLISLLVQLVKSAEQIVGFQVVGSLAGLLSAVNLYVSGRSRIKFSGHKPELNRCP